MILKMKDQKTYLELVNHFYEMEYHKLRENKKTIRDIELINNPFVKRIYEKVESYVTANNITNKVKITDLEICHSRKRKLTTISGIHVEKVMYVDGEDSYIFYEIFRIGIYKENCFFHFIDPFLSKSDDIAKFNKVAQCRVLGYGRKSVHDIFQISEEELMPSFIILDKSINNYL